MSGPRRPIDLRVEFDAEPTNVPRDRPRFSWRVPTDDRDERQTAYRVFVARDRDALAEDRGYCWDSGIVTAPTNSGVAYNGSSLAPDAEYYWKVRVQVDGTTLPDSPVRRFETAPDPTRWDASWISHQPNGGDANGFRTPWRAIASDPSPDETPGATEWVQLDLGEPTEIAMIDLYPTCPFDGPTTPDGSTASALYSWDLGDEPTHTRDGPDGFGFPRRYRILGGTTPTLTDPSVVIDRAAETQPNPGSERVRHDVSASARYVRIEAVEPYVFDPERAPQAGGHEFEDEGEPVAAQIEPEKIREDRRPWRTFALAAVAVRTPRETDAARTATVTVSSSHESETWGREMLVDGRYRSTMATAAPLLRTTVPITGAVERARAHVAAVGYGELTVNGEQVGDRVLDPAWTDYAERVPITTYDLTGHLESGENAIGCWLGRGRFAHNFYDWTGFGSPRVLARIVVDYADGSRLVHETGPWWQTTESPITENHVYDGETYDARREESGWDTAGFEDAHWADATEVDPPGGDLVPQRIEPIRVVTRRSPDRIRDGADGTIIDFGQNLTGWIRLTVRGAATGQRIDVRHAETTTADGDLDTRTLRTARAVDTYYTRGDDREVYEPRFTYHGFRYVEICGYPDELSPADVEACVVHTDLERTGVFDCSNDALERVQENATWGLRGNAHGVPTDCPQRDERFGWTGDGRISAGAYLCNYEPVRLFQKWLRDHDDAQTTAGCLPDTIPHGPGSLPSDPAWTVTQVRIPWLLYRYYGDERVLRSRFTAMRRYADYWDSVAENGLIPEDYAIYGDWLALEHLDDRGVIGQPTTLFSTAAHYETTATVARIADVLGYDPVATALRSRAEGIASAFTERFFDPATATYGPGSQAAQALPLYLGIVPEGSEGRVADRLVTVVRDADGTLRTGFLGTRALLFALADTGHAPLAYRVVNHPGHPGWMDMVARGATTLWESWNTLDHLALDPDDGVKAAATSLNHPSFACVSEWFYAVLAGIRPDRDTDGRALLRIRPEPVPGLDHAGGTLRLPAGPVESRWKRTDTGLAHVVSVPWNSTATVTVPTPRGGRLATVVVDGTRLWSAANSVVDTLPTGVRDVDTTVRAQSGRDNIATTVRLTLGSGTYEFGIDTTHP